MNRRPRARLHLEGLERRDTPSAVAEVEGNNTFATYQPLNKDSTFKVTGNIAALSDVDFYAVYVKQGGTIQINCRATRLTGNLHTEFDPTIGLFSPDGVLLSAQDDGGVGSIWAADITYAVPASGIYRVAVSHYSDFSFDGSNTRPSYDPNNPSGTGPGVHTGRYQLTITGAQKPEVVVKTPADQTEFKIDGDSPKMPTLTAELIGVVPPPGAQVSVEWQTRVAYRAADYPAKAGVRGPGRDIPSPAYGDHTVDGSTEFTPDFQVNGSEVIRGGTLVLTAKTRVGGQPVRVNTPRTGDDRLTVLGTNPSATALSAYVDGLAVPANWPANSGHDYHTVLRQIISQESVRAQFDPDGVPLWSRDKLRGVGLMQITKPAPTPDQTWDWRRNVDAGAALFGGEKLAGGISRLNKLFAKTQQQAAAVGAVAAPVTGEMIVLQAIRAFNGYNNGFGSKDEYRAVRDADDDLIIANGQTAWERVPVEDRGPAGGAGAKGDRNYVENVLGQSDF